MKTCSFGFYTKFINLSQIIKPRASKPEGIILQETIDRSISFYFTCRFFPPAYKLLALDEKERGFL